MQPHVQAVAPRPTLAAATGSKSVCQPATGTAILLFLCLGDCVKGGAQFSVPKSNSGCSEIAG